MRKSLRILKNGSRYYSFIYFDKEISKTIRLSKDFIRKRFGGDITSEEEADKAIKILDAEHLSKVQKIELRMEWEKKYYNFSKLVEIYKQKQMIKAPNSYKNGVHFLKHYVLHYFLMVAQCNNIESWPLHYESFRLWLEKSAKLILNDSKSISYGSKNHCIKALNTFMRHLYAQKIISNLHLCESFSSHLLNERTIDDVITKDEMELLYKTLKFQGNKLEAVFLRCLYFTGMRFNEALGISMADIFSGEIQHSTIKNLLVAYKIECHGYIVLSSQPKSEARGLKDKNGQILRKPLKGQKKISEKYSRIIPITDKELWQQIAHLFNAQLDLYSLKNSTEKSPSNFGLFDGLVRATATRRLIEAYKINKLRYRSWHCCRHSCATNLIGETRDYTLARLWLGHRSPIVIEKYVHVHQAIIRSSSQLTEGGYFKRINV